MEEIIMYIRLVNNFQNEDYKYRYEKQKDQLV